MNDSDPQLDRIIAFAAGDLPAPDAADVAAWLSDHPDAMRLVHLYKAVARTASEDASVDPPAEVTRRAKAIFPARAAASPGPVARLTELVASLVFDSRAQVAGVRDAGPTETRRLSWEAGPLDVDLQIEPGDAPGRWHLLGQIGHDHRGGATVRVRDAGTDRVVAETVACERGLFDLDLQPGTYDLHLALAGFAVTLQDVLVP